MPACRQPPLRGEPLPRTALQRRYRVAASSDCLPPHSTIALVTQRLQPPITRQPTRFHSLTSASAAPKWSISSRLGTWRPLPSHNTRRQSLLTRPLRRIQQTSSTRITVIAFCTGPGPPASHKRRKGNCSSHSIRTTITTQ